jgi:hypothetical protein
MRILFADIVISIENIYAQMLHVRSPNPLDHAAMQSKYFIIQQLKRMSIVYTIEHGTTSKMFKLKYQILLPGVECAE